VRSRRALLGNTHQQIHPLSMRPPQLRQGRCHWFLCNHEVKRPTQCQRLRGVGDAMGGRQGGNRSLRFLTVPRFCGYFRFPIDRESQGAAANTPSSGIRGRDDPVCRLVLFHLRKPAMVCAFYQRFWFAATVVFSCTIRGSCARQGTSSVCRQAPSDYQGHPVSIRKGCERKSDRPFKHPESCWTSVPVRITR